MPDRHSAGRYSGATFDASLLNSEGSSLKCLTPVALWSDGTAKKASCTSRALATLAGLLLPDLTLDGTEGGIAAQGLVKAATAQWDAVTGQSGGLTPGTIYYLGTAGALSATRPTTPGYFEVVVGLAITSEEMALRISNPVRLSGIAKVSDYSILPEDNGSTFTTSGASGTVILTLPPWLPGFEVEFVIDSDNILEVVADGTDVLRYGRQLSAAGGNIQAATRGYAMRVASEASGLWVVENATGSWSVT